MIKVLRNRRRGEAVGGPRFAYPLGSWCGSPRVLVGGPWFHFCRIWLHIESHRFTSNIRCDFENSMWLGELVPRTSYPAIFLPAVLGLCYPVEKNCDSADHSFLNNTNSFQKLDFTSKFDVICKLKSRLGKLDPRCPGNHRLLYIALRSPYIDRIPPHKQKLSHSTQFDPPDPQANSMWFRISHRKNPKSQIHIGQKQKNFPAIPYGCALECGFWGSCGVFILPKSGPRWSGNYRLCQP